jgi:formate dehydrogenase major subunit
VAGLAASFGSGAMTNSMSEIENTDLIFITGSNTAETHPIVGYMVKRAVDRKRAKLIIVDPRKIELTKFAHIWLRPRPGTDVAWINGLAHVIIAEGLWDKSYVDARTEGFEDLRASVTAYTPEYVETVSGIPAADLRKAARLYAQAPRAMILYAMGITQHAAGTDNVKALANLAMLCGNVGIEGGGLNPLRGQNNVQGACDVGALPNTLPGYQPVTDEQVLARFQQGWGTGVRLSNRAGMTMTEMFPAVLEGKLKAMFIMGENPVLSDADASHGVKALKALDLLVVQDLFLTETAQLADVVLPAASFAEKDGTFTNTERRVQRVRKAITPPGEARADWEIICALAKRVSTKLEALQGGTNEHAPTRNAYGYWDYRAPSEVFDEIGALTPSYAGISYERLERGGLQWPCPNQYHPGTPYLHKGRFARGLGKFFAIGFTPPAELPDAEYPFYLSTGRIRYHYHTGTMTRRSRGLDRVAQEERIEMHPEDAAQMGIAEGDWVRVASRRGEVKARVRLTDRSAPGMVFGTFHFAETPINQLTGGALDPVAKIPAYKVCAVRVEKIESRLAERQAALTQACEPIRVEA